MLKRTSVSCGLFSIVKEELRKLPAYLSFRAKEAAGQHVDSAAKTFDFLKGNSPSDTPEIREKRQKHKEMYDAILREQMAQQAALREKQKAHSESLSWQEKLAAAGKELKQSLQAMVSRKAGVMALLQHCTASHAAEIAVEQGIDVKNVQMVLEKQQKPNAVGYEEVVVGYIDAPHATESEVFAFAEKLHKACPVANTMHVEWRHGTGGREEPQPGAERPLVNEDVFAHRERDGLGAAGAGPADAIPMGTPGSWRGRSRGGFRAGGEPLRRGGFGEEDDLHLPGVGPRRTTEPSAEMSRGTPGDHRLRAERSAPATASVKDVDGNTGGVDK